MKTKNCRTRVYEGDSCKVNPKLNYEEHLIEDHPQQLIEDHPQKFIENHHVEEPVAAMAAPEESGGSSQWWAWCVAGLIGLCLIAVGFYFGFKNDNESAKYAHATTQNEVGAKTYALSGASGGDSSIAVPQSVEEYVYYFGNDKSSVPDNTVLNQLADKVEETGADITVTAYASTVGNADYNENLSTKRADNVAKYLIAHGVPSNHVKIVPSGETSDYGDVAHNRRANIHVVYPG